MGGIFSIDGILYKIGTLIFDMFFLNLLWVICSIPIVTVGASTTALFYVCGKRIRGEEGYLVKDFFKSFTMNFKQSTIAWLIILLGIFILWIDFKSISLMGNFTTFFYILFLVISYELLIITIYIFAILSRFYIKTANLIKTAFFMANRHFLMTICCILVMVLDIFLTLNFGFFIFFMFSSYALLASYLFKVVFDKYTPKEDKEDDNLYVRD